MAKKVLDRQSLEDIVWASTIWVLAEEALPMMG